MDNGKKWEYRDPEAYIETNFQQMPDKLKQILKEFIDIEEKETKNILLMNKLTISKENKIKFHRKLKSFFNNRSEKGSFTDFQIRNKLKLFLKNSLQIFLNKLKIFEQVKFISQ